MREEPVVFLVKSQVEQCRPMCCTCTRGLPANGYPLSMHEPQLPDCAPGCPTKQGCKCITDGSVSCPPWVRERRKDDGYYCEKDLYLQIRTLSILYQGCFYYDELNSSEAKSVLQNCAVGTYLVRNSSNPRFLYTISVRTKRGPTSIRVLYEHGLFSLDADEKSRRFMPTFSNFLDLIDFYVRVGSSKKKSDKCRFLDKHGKKDLPIVLTKPKLNDVPTLKHIARVTINRTLPASKFSEIAPLVDQLPIPRPLKSILKDYPYRF